MSMEAKSESDLDASRTLDTFLVSTRSLDLVQGDIPGASSNSNGFSNEGNGRDRELLHHTGCLDRQVGSSRDIPNEVAEGTIARVIEQEDVTLRQWLDKPERSVDLLQCLHIFKQIVEIVNLAHSKGTVAHNIRPSCFVISALSRVSLVESTSCSGRGSDIRGEPLIRKIAECQSSSPLLYKFQSNKTESVDSKLELTHAEDLRRAHQMCCLQPTSITTMYESTRRKIIETEFQDIKMGEQREESISYLPVKQIVHAEIGWYTSPEEVSGAPSSFSSDIYRLGVLLFELVCTFSSVEEKLSTMSNLRHRVLPPVLLLKWPKEASFCLWLLHPQSSTRPKMSELLQSEFLNEPREEHEAVTELKSDIEEQELLLDFLFEMQRQKRDSANKLHDTIACLSSDIDEVLLKQSITVKTGDSYPESSKYVCSASRNVDYKSQRQVTDDRFTRSGSRKRFRPVQISVENRCDRYSDDIQKSETPTENHEHLHSKSTWLRKNFKKLESVYFSTRARMMRPVEKLPNRYYGISSNGRGSSTINGGSSVNNMDFNVGNYKYRKNGWLNPFLEGLNSYLSFSKLKIRADLNQGEFLNTSNLVCSLMFDRDKEFFASAGVARKIKVFDYHMILNEDCSIQYPVVEMASKSKISSICWNSYIKSQIASCDFEGVVQIWDVTRGQVCMEMMEHERRVWSIDFSSADPMKLASGSDDATVKLWNINQGGSIGTIRTKANVCCVQFPPDSARSVVFGSADHKIYCYDLRNTKIPWCTLVGHAKTVSYVKFVDSTTLVSASTDNTLKLWDLSTCTSQVLDHPVHTFTGHVNAKNFVGLSTCDGYIATGSETDEVYIYHKAFPMPMLSFKFSNTDSHSSHEVDDGTQFVSSVCWQGQSSTLAAANSTGNIKLLEMV